LFSVASFPYALNYLKNIDELSTNQKQSAADEIKRFYDEIINRKHNNGWILTDIGGAIKSNAFVAKFLSFSSDWIEIDDAEISASLQSAVEEQKSDGKFIEKFSKENSVADEVTLTAFVVISIFENERYAERFAQQTAKALNFTNEKFNEVKDVHALAIAAYALSIGNDKENAKKFLGKLMDNVTFVDGQASLKEIETGAYAALALSRLGRSVEAVGIIKWLVTQQNAQTGGFKSTIDSMLAFQAAAEIAKHLHASDFDLNLKFTSGDKTAKVHINNSNKNKMQTVTIKSKESVNVNAAGTGVVFIQAQQKYIERSDEHAMCSKPSTKDKKEENSGFWESVGNEIKSWFS
jgi:A-macroglobulin TED domain